MRILADDIIPLLEEYCYENYDALTKILGAGMVDETKQRIRAELFAVSRREELIQALLAPSPEIVTSRDAAVAAPTADETKKRKMRIGTRECCNRKASANGKLYLLMQVARLLSMV